MQKLSDLRLIPNGRSRLPSPCAAMTWAPEQSLHIDDVERGVQASPTRLERSTVRRRELRARDVVELKVVSDLGKQKAPVRPLRERPDRGRHGADDRDRTGDLHLGKVTLYQLSHIREKNRS